MPGMGNPEALITWLGGSRGGQSNPDNGCVVAVTGIPEELVTEIPEALTM